MLFREFGANTDPTILLLHGERLSWWSFADIIPHLSKHYHVIVPVIDGHGEDSETPFVSISDAAQKLIAYIDSDCSGKVLTIFGVSFGAQIVIEAITKRNDIAKYVVLQSASVLPSRLDIRVIQPVCKLYDRLLRQKWLSQIQAKSLCVKPVQFDQYYQDLTNITETSMANIIKSAVTYSAPDTLRNASIKALFVIRSGETLRLRRSVRKLMALVPHSQVCIVPGIKRGELNADLFHEYMGMITHYTRKDPRMWAIKEWT